MWTDMKKWVADYIKQPEKAMIPVLSFPVINLMGITVKDFISDSDIMAKGIKLVTEKTGMPVFMSPMDLSVEAEAFGSEIKYSDHEVPATVGAIVSSEEEAKALEIPEAGKGRTGIYMDAVKKLAADADKPILAGVIGPFSLAGRLMDVSEAMFYCYDEPDMVHIVMEKCTDYLIKSCLKYKEAGANGVLMAEPLTGLLSPSLAEEFSIPYVTRLIKEIQTDDFVVIYHNCGNSTVQMADSIFSQGAAGYHFGNIIRLKDILEKAPKDVVVFGNVDPVLICNGKPDVIRAAVQNVMNECSSYENFAISSGCDIPPVTPWENINALFTAVSDYYQQKP